MNPEYPWDITTVRGPEKGVWFSLLAMIDAFSRYVAGWTLVRSANAKIAKTLIDAVLRCDGTTPDRAVVYADRSTELAAQPLCVLPDALGVKRTHSRPRVSNDNLVLRDRCSKCLSTITTLPERFERAAFVANSIYFTAGEPNRTPLTQASAS